jgi:hypothetical protein
MQFTLYNNTPFDLTFRYGKAGCTICYQKPGETKKVWVEGGYDGSTCWSLHVNSKQWTEMTGKVVPEKDGVMITTYDWNYLNGSLSTSENSLVKLGEVSKNRAGEKFLELGFLGEPLVKACRD